MNAERMGISLNGISVLSFIALCCQFSLLHAGDGGSGCKRMGVLTKLKSPGFGMYGRSLIPMPIYSSGA
jgi:hypothetical protein